MIKTTSFSRLKDFRECPLKAKLKFVDKVPDPQPPPPAGTEHPMDRGSRIHELAEQAVRNGSETLPAAIAKFEPRFRILQELYKQSKAHVEYAIAMDANWARSDPKDFENTTYRMIADVLVELPDAGCLVIDHKTGRKDGNEVVHSQQGVEYLCATSMVFTNYQRFRAEIWYLDHGDVLHVDFTRNELAPRVQDFIKAHEQMRQATLFPARPSHQACRYCPFKKGTVGRGKNAYAGTGHCDQNVN